MVTGPVQITSDFNNPIPSKYVFTARQVAFSMLKEGFLPV